MTREEFTEMVRDAIRDNVSGSTCGCCGTVEIDGIPDAVAEIVAATYPTTNPDKEGT